MPKKTTTARGASQRNRPKSQKNIELVRQPKEAPVDSGGESTAVGVSTMATPSPVSAVESPTAKETLTAKATPASKETQPSKGESSEVVTSAASKGSVSEGLAARRGEDEQATKNVVSKGSASERLAARRQAVQKQRTAVNLISAEHYSYVRRDLIFIAILAAIMFSVIIILHFVPAIGG